MIAVELEKLITVALKEDKVNFVRLFLQNGVNMATYLTRDKLLELYSIVRTSFFIYQLTAMSCFSQIISERLI